MMYRLSFFLAILLNTGVLFVSKAQNTIVEKIPFVINDEHIIIKIGFNNSEPLNFIFDSGAGATLISNSAADSLGFEHGLKRKNVGVSGEHKVSLIRGVELFYEERNLGDVNLLSTQTYFEELDNGEAVHGVIGYDILADYVIEINYDQFELILYEEDSYNYNGDGKELPIYIVQNLPITNAVVSTYNNQEFEGQFMIDTGARSDIIISSPTVVKYGLAENVGKHYTLRATIGTSSRRTKMRYGRLENFQLANFKFENIPVALSSDNKGVLSMDFIDGIIGNRLLRRFNITFDYGKEMVYLKPGDSISSKYIINLTGFNINFVSGKPIIKNIIDRSPADKAGLRSGDQIISINSVLVENMSTDEIRKAFTLEEAQLALVIKRNNKFKYTELKPKPLI